MLSLFSDADLSALEMRIKNPGMGFNIGTLMPLRDAQISQPKVSYHSKY